MTTGTHPTSEQAPVADVERLKRQIYDEWQSAALVAAYRKWEEEESAWGSGATALIVERARVVPGMTVLDLASGHGEPALALAAAVGPTGHVTATDQGPGLIAIAEERARRAGLTNLTVRVADAHALPFPDGAFDRVTSRFGLMYFVELQRALRESRRVLKPGGRAAFMAWGSVDQPLLEILIGTLFKYVTPPEQEPGTPSPFMFAEPGTLADALREAGFTDVEEEYATAGSPFPGTPSQYWEWFWDLVPPVRPLLDALSPGDRQQALDEALAALGPFYNGQRVDIPLQVVIGSGNR